MDFQPTDTQRALVEALHDLSVNEIRPHAREFEAEGRPAEAVAKQLFEMGVAPVPEEHGGQGTFDAVTSVLIAEEVAWGDPGVAFSVLNSGAAATIIDLAGSEEQRKALLPRIAAGETGSVALAERDAGADPSVLESEAKASDGEVIITGTKYAVPNFEEAAVRLVVTRGSGPLAVWALPQGVEVRAAAEDKLGLRSARTYKVVFEGNLYAAEAIGGGVDPAKIELALLRTKLINAGIALGLARASLEYASDYAKDRTAFGKPIGAFQGISFKIADRATEIDAARNMVWKAAWAVDRSDEGSAVRVMAACGHAVAAALATADDGVQILGGHGYMKDHPQEMWYRDAMTLATLDSPSTVGDLFLAERYRPEKASAR